DFSRYAQLAGLTVAALAVLRSHFAQDLEALFACSVFAFAPAQAPVVAVHVDTAGLLSHFRLPPWARLRSVAIIVFLSSFPDSVPCAIRASATALTKCQL